MTTVALSLSEWVLAPTQIPWLPELPGHWEMAHLRFITRCLDGRRVPLNAEERANRGGLIPYWGANRVIDHIDSWLFDEPLVLLGEDGAPFFDPRRDVAFAVRGRIWVNNHAHVLRCHPRVEPRFLARVLNHVDYRLFVSGSTRDKLTQQSMGGIPVQLPPLEEQELLIRFMDRADISIARAVTAKRQLVEFLDEERRAITSQLVTRGLGPSPTYTFSGVQFLGNVPGHWEVRPAKWLYREVNERSQRGEEQLMSVSHLTGVTPRSTKNVTMFMAASYAGHKLCRPGDLVINTMWAWMGALGVAAETGIVSPAYGVYRPVPGSPLQPDYADLLLRTRPYIDEYTCRSTGIRSSRLRLYPDRFLTVPIVYPPEDEQRQIVARVNEATGDLDAAIAAELREIELLQEYRTRLIADVCTGRRDVRAEAASLPELDAADLDAVISATSADDDVEEEDQE